MCPDVSSDLTVTLSKQRLGGLGELVMRAFRNNRVTCVSPIPSGAGQEKTTVQLGWLSAQFPGLGCFINAGPNSWSPLPIRYIQDSHIRAWTVGQILVRYKFVNHDT